MGIGAGPVTVAAKLHVSGYKRACIGGKFSLFAACPPLA
jgi:hypothetical protein